MTSYGPDVSSYQPNTQWSAVGADGNQFGISKATQGVGYVNPMFAHDVAGIKGAGLLRGAYHFGTPKDNPGTAGARAEAAHFATVVGQQGGLADAHAFRPILDLEGPYIAGFGVGALTDWTEAWFTEANARLGTPGGIVYANFYDARDQMDGRQLTAAGRQLWLAAYTASVPTCPPGWPDYLLQQYTDHATITGVAGPCDRSIARGSLTPLLSAPGPVAQSQHWSMPQTVTDPVTHETLTLNTHVDVWFALAQGQHDFAETIAVQYWLNRNGAALQLDGVFGPQTYAGVRAYQTKVDLTSDGIVRAATAVRLGITTP